RLHSWESADVVHAGSSILVEDVCQVLLELVFRYEVRYHDARRPKLAVRADCIDPPRVAIAPDREDAAEDIEANHESPARGSRIFTPLRYQTRAPRRRPALGRLASPGSLYPEADRGYSLGTERSRPDLTNDSEAAHGGADLPGALRRAAGRDRAGAGQAAVWR